jgi:hypothetical protein
MAHAAGGSIPIKKKIVNFSLVKNNIYIKTVFKIKIFKTSKK